MENSRVIKFRAWDKEKKEMYYIGQDTEIAGINSPVLEIYGNGEWFLEWGYADDEFDLTEKTGILMQYTGLKDKNGKEIYEGDIIEPEEKGIRDIIYYQVFYCAPEFLIKDNYGMINTFFWSWHWEVIGNIYENPEKLD